MKHIKFFSALVVISLLFLACSIEKRLHRPGYFIKFNQKTEKSTAKADSHPDKAETATELTQIEPEHVQIESTQPVDEVTDLQASATKADGIQNETKASFFREVERETGKIAEQLKEEQDFSYKSIYGKAKNSASSISGKRYNPRLFLLIPLGLLFLGLIAISFGFVIFFIVLVMEGGISYIEDLFPSFVYWGIGLVLLIGALISNIIIRNKILKPKGKKS